MFSRILGAVVVAVAVLLAGAAYAESTIKLETYAGRLRQVEVDIAGAKRKFMFDTGGGYTIISPAVAAAIGCAPKGRIFALRMSGEPFTTPTCAGVSYGLGSLRVRDDVAGVFDLMSLLPKDLPPLDGLISLKSFEGHRFALDLSANVVVIDGDVRGGPFPCRIATGLDGSNLTLFARIDQTNQRLWFEVDSGNLADVRLAVHAAPLFGADAGAPKVIALSLGGAKPVNVMASAGSIIYDGALNAAFLERGTLYAALSDSPRCRWLPHER